ncbi:MAG: SUMF1/EgtB/PvdO family nonheme iron enzyme [Labilithrix sp.]|nr:SUMF1/EgtB/PvdO family nonheme iron enzyme [Labilithrix sp.]
MRTVVVGLVVGWVGILAFGCSTTPVNADSEITPPLAGNPNGADVGGDCQGAGDCKSGICSNGTCQPATPRDGVRNGDETDVDCGGSIAPKCLAGKGCAQGSDCTSGVCAGGKCGAGTADDGVKNGDETDVDCGGASSPKCGAGKACLDATNCESAICNAGACAAPSPTDGVKNGDETDIDCGGTIAAKCESGRACKAGGDCTSLVCKDALCISASANDGVKNATETDVDCGGPDAGTPRCATGKICVAGGDCASLVCDGATKQCKAPTGTDGVKNGDESDVDCGGTTTGAPKCGVAKTCKVHADCASDGCDDGGKCALRRSCTRRLGGRTCGVGESNDPASPHESCCTTITFTSGGRTVNLDKYDVTAGRMRAFVDRFNGNLRGAMTGYAGFPQQWLGNLPQNQDEVNARLGPYEVFEEAPRVQGSRMVDGCYIAGQGTRTWWAPATAGDPTKMSRDQLDEKALNCVNFYMLYALCAWDGGRLPTSTEIQAAWKGNDNRSYPWGNTLEDARMIHKFNYYHPLTNAAGQLCAQGNCDNSIFIGAPGRRGNGYGPFGHADLAGLMFNFVWDGDYVGKWIWTGSWENHVPTVQGQIADLRARPRYWAAGGRCAR